MPCYLALGSTALLLTQTSPDHARPPGEAKRQVEMAKREREAKEREAERKAKAAEAEVAELEAEEEVAATEQPADVLVDIFTTVAAAGVAAVDYENDAVTFSKILIPYLSQEFLPSDVPEHEFTL